MEQLVIREGDLFLVANRRGDLDPAAAACGLFLRDTRFLSRCELKLDGAAPRVLSVSAAEGYLLCCSLEGNSVTVDRRWLIHGGILYQQISVTSQIPARVTLELIFDADFADIFEVRGVQRAARGEMLTPRVVDTVTLAYHGLDGVGRTTTLRFSPAVTELTASSACWDLTLEPGTAAVLAVAVVPSCDGSAVEAAGFTECLADMQAAYRMWHDSCTGIETGSDLVNRVLERSVADLRLLTADRGYGPFPVAGIPWFAVPFGRDSIITALFSLGLNPDLARGTLRTLAALQGQTTDAARQEEPGKILHELRTGEMAHLDEVPFGRYYGSVDSTPLFLVLVCEYYAWTGDLDLVRELLPRIRAALGWMDKFGDGFLQFRADSGLGLVVQSWKDSPDSISHRDGRPAASPVAVSEVQGYAYDARRRLAPILALLGDVALAGQLERQAEALRKRFNESFWMDDQQYYAIALDGGKARVETIASDIGHCLWSGIVDDARAGAVARRLLAPDLFSGWGIRTLSTEAVTYDPASYHNGSVWPHDGALCAVGLKRYGFDQEVGVVATALLEAAGRFEHLRLPELFCGNSRDEWGPVEYPGACSPQAWAAAAPLALVQALLGLRPDAAAGELRVRPNLPAWLGSVTLRGLRVGAARVHLEVTPEGVKAEVEGGAIRVVVEA